MTHAAQRVALVILATFGAAGCLDSLRLGDLRIVRDGGSDAGANRVDGGPDAGADPDAGTDAGADAGTDAGPPPCVLDRECGPTGVAVCEAGVCRTCAYGGASEVLLGAGRQAVLDAELSIVLSDDGDEVWGHLGWIGTFGFGDTSRDAFVTSSPLTGDPNLQVRHALSRSFPSGDFVPASVALAQVPGDPSRVQVLYAGNAMDGSRGFLAQARILTAGGDSSLDGPVPLDDIVAPRPIIPSVGIVTDAARSRFAWIEDDAGVLLRSVDFDATDRAEASFRAPLVSSTRYHVPGTDHLFVFQPAGADTLHYWAAIPPIGPVTVPVSSPAPVGWARLSATAALLAQARDDRVQLRRVSCPPCSVEGVEREHEAPGRVTGISLAPLDEGAALAVRFENDDASPREAGVVLYVLDRDLAIVPTASGELCDPARTDGCTNWLQTASLPGRDYFDIRVASRQSEGRTTIVVAYANVSPGTTITNVTLSAITIAPGCPAP